MTTRAAHYDILSVHQPLRGSRSIQPSGPGPRHHDVGPGFLPASHGKHNATCLDTGQAVLATGTEDFVLLVVHLKDHGVEHGLYAQLLRLLDKAP